MNLADLALDDTLRLDTGNVFLSGVQALARLPMLQRVRDRAAGLNTAGYVSGYRGSPLGGLDTALHEAQALLAAHGVRFHPAVNEDLAATAIWGTQQLRLLPGAKRDGIFAMWYGKGPGVDRCGDVFKHANQAGTSAHGGVLVVAGDDHAARSSAVAHQSEHMFSACAMPVLAPAGVQEIIDFGVHGWAMSRYCGCWVALKLSADIVESSATVDVNAMRVKVRRPTDFELPADGVNIRWPDPAMAQERRMQAYKIYAAAAYARANGLDRIVFDSPQARLGVVASGKAWLDLRQALYDLGIDSDAAARLGVRVYKVGMPWPLEADGARRFATGLEEILVVEEKRQIIEYQLKEMLYDWRDPVRPRVLGKFDESGEWPAPHGPWLLPPTGELTPALIASALASRLARLDAAGGWIARADALAGHGALSVTPADRRPVPDTGAGIQGLAPAMDPGVRRDDGCSPATTPPAPQRPAYFCSGCPHNRSTQVPEGSCAFGGVGCHLMAVTMERRTLTISQMGGEGAAWIGMAEHAGAPHVFVNMGDGTYFHSGLLAIRAAVAADVNITYKLLYNDAVAMTGGQPVDGNLSVPRLTCQIAAEGVARIVVLADDTHKYPRDALFAPGVQVRPREQLDAVQRELRLTHGVSVLVYDQTCATEVRRRRRRGTLPTPLRHVFINEALCEGCGDCSLKSNCLSIVPVDTEFGEKRAIDPYTCNFDLTCLEGCCPALVTVQAPALKQAKGLPVDAAALPEPALPSLAAPYSLLIAGVGGSGVVTLGALLGTAAFLEGKGVSVLDHTGMSQKGGAVLTHVRIAATPDALHALRVDRADVLLGCDLLVAASSDTLQRVRSDRTRAVLNTAELISGDFIRHPEQRHPSEALLALLHEAVLSSDELDATRLASLLVGHSIASNLFMLGFAWQRGLVPLGHAALQRSIELNGVAVADNQRAFAWGRCAAAQPQQTARQAADAEVLPAAREFSRNLDEVVARRRAELVDYQYEALASRYVALVERVRRAEHQVAPHSERLADAVARQAFRLLAYKDEYEVARLFSSPEFDAALAARFEGDYRVQFHLTLPWRRGAGAGEPPKQVFGAWMGRAMRVLAFGKYLRGTLLDPFSYSAQRRLERALAAEYLAGIERVLHKLDAGRLDAAVAIAELPARIRGFGPVKHRHALAVRARLAELLAAYEVDVSLGAPLAPAQIQLQAQPQAQPEASSPVQLQTQTQAPSQAHAA